MRGSVSISSRIDKKRKVKLLKDLLDINVNYIN
jgi:hypothetical protein